MSSFLKFLELFLQAFAGAKKLYDLAQRKVKAIIRREAIEEAINDKDTSDLERIIND